MDENDLEGGVHIVVQLLMGIDQLHGFRKNPELHD